MIQYKSKFVDLQIKEADNDNERKLQCKDIVSANHLLFAALQLIETEAKGECELVHLQLDDNQSH